MDEALSVTRPPAPPLRPFVSLLWASHEPPSALGDRERVLPTGRMHLVIRLSEQPVRIFRDLADAAGDSFGHSVVGGAREAFHLRDVSQPMQSVGAMLEPGAAQLLFGVPADELAGRHTPLECLWARAPAMRERLAETPSLRRRVDLLESFLAARLPKVRALHPAVAHALARFRAAAGVREVARETGYSHRRFIALFRQAAGLPPKLYCRIERFGAALRRVRTADSLLDLALDAGYSDQAHFNRDFQQFTGLSPGWYRELAPRSAHHIPVRAGRA